MKKVLSLFFTIFLFTQVHATHILAGDITYKWIGPGANTYLVSLSLQRDCEGLALPLLETITAKSTCGDNFQFSIELNASTVHEISQLCPTMIGMSLCNGGTFPGTQFYKYQDTVNLTSACPNWTFSWTECCRNSTANVPTSPTNDFYLESKLNLAAGTHNNSPFYSSQNGIYANVNQAYNFNIGVVETDGDSLKNEITAAKLTSTVDLTYGAGYSALQPIPGITIDQHTGLLNFTPTVIGKFIIAVKTTEYNAQGQVKGSVIKDFEIIVISSVNQHPDINSGVISNLSSNAALNGNNEIEICSNNTFSFEASYFDSDTANSLTFISNLDEIVGSNNYSYTISGTNPLNVTYTIHIPTGMNNFSFIATLSDDNCPDFALQNYQYNVKVIPSISDLQDQIVCGTDATQLNVTGGSTFTWYDLSGNLIPVDATFSCNPCANPIVSPNTTNTYIVQSNILNGCANTDTVTIYYSNDVFTLSLLSDTNACLNSPFAINTLLSPAGNYNFVWSPDSLLDNSTSATPQFLANYPGNFWIYNTVTNGSGCVSKDSIQIDVSPNAQFNAVAVSDTVCIGSANYLQVNVSLNSNNILCGFANNSFQNGIQNIEIGQDTLFNSDSGYPAVFGNYYWGAKHQMLYKASEMIAMGANAGGIDKLSFYVESLNTSNTIYNSVNIQIKCSQIDSLSGWETGMSTVFSVSSYTVHTGWNTFNFNNVYNWDGASNIIIQFCFNNASWTSNCSNTYSTTPFNSVIYFRGDNNSICQGTALTASNLRPNIKFGFCSNFLLTNSYTYAWSPSNFLVDDDIYNPLTTVPNAGTYQVVVTDIIGGCTDTAIVIAQNNGINGALSPVINANNLLLTTGPAAAYQWFYNGIAIAGADSSSIVPVLDGDYMVQVFDTSGCSAMSNPFSFLIAQVTNLKTIQSYISPNPADNYINLKSNISIEKMVVQLFNLEGMLLKEWRNITSERISLETFSNGLYILRTFESNNPQHIENFKLIISK